MKRRELIKRIEAEGGFLIHHGGKHDWDFGDGTRGTGTAVSHVYQNMGVYGIVATATDGLASVTIASTATVTDAMRITQVKLKNYDPVAGTGKKLSVIATDSRQSQIPRPTLTIIGVGEMSYDEDSRAYTFFIKKARKHIGW